MTGHDDRIVTMTGPEHCTLLVGLPTSREQFNASLALGGRGYASSFLGGWSQYEALFLDNLRYLAAYAEKIGVRYAGSASCERLGNALSDAERPIVILFSHTSRDDMEMAGRFVAPEHVLGVVPDQYAGVFDICACQPIAMAGAMVEARPSCLIRFLPAQVDPVAWMVYFQAVFALLNSRRYSYLKASEEVTIALINQARQL